MKSLVPLVRGNQPLPPTTPPERPPVDLDTFRQFKEGMARRAAYEQRVMPLPHYRPGGESA